MRRAPAGAGRNLARPNVRVGLIETFPSVADAPWALWEHPGNCGLLTAWAVLRYFGVRVDSRQLPRECCWTQKHGTFPIALAVALRQRGLEVAFHSDPDPTPHRIERAGLRRAAGLGIPTGPALPLRSVLARHRDGWLPVVLYDLADGSGHISPLLGTVDGRVQLPFGDEPQLATATFLRRWRAPEVLRQCILVRRSQG